MQHILAAFIVLLTSSHLLAQPAHGDVQPDRIDFGTIYTNSIQEGSILFYVSGKDDSIPLVITTPASIRIIHQVKRTVSYSNGDLVRGRIHFSFHPGKTGDIQEVIKVKLGQNDFHLVVKANVKPAREGLKRVLIAGTPYYCQATSDSTVFDAWRTLVKQSFLDVSCLAVLKDKPVLRDLDLKRYDCVLLGCEGIYYLTPEDIKRVRAYVQEGGQLVLTADYFFRGTVAKANEVLQDTGLDMQDMESRNMEEHVAILKDKDIDEKLHKAGVKSLRFHRGSPIAINDPAKGRVLVKTWGVGNPDDALVAETKWGKGRILVLGTSLWWNWITPSQAAGADNAKLLEWMLTSKSP